MDNFLNFLHSLNLFLTALERVNSNPNEPPPRNARRNLRSWRRAVLAEWENLEDVELAMSKFKGIQWSAILSPTKFAFGYYEEGNQSEKVAEFGPEDATFFSSITKLLIHAAAQQP